MYSCGLVLEGGGNRAIYTSGVLDAFMDQGITFPYVIGVSAGSCNAVSYIGKCRGRQHDISIQYSGDKRFMSLENMIKNGEFLNGEWLFGELSYDLSPLDQEAYDRANTTLCVVVTNALTGKAEYMYPKDFHKRGCPILRASCALPGATKGVVLGKDRYFDGAVTDSIPLAHAYEDGCQKAVVVLTQDRNYQKQPMGHARLIRRIFRKYPLMTRAILNRYKIYNRQLEAVWDAQGRGDAFVIAPDHPLHCPTLERNTDKLEQIYQTGYRNAIADLNLTDCGVHYIDVTDSRSVRQTIATILALPERPTALCVWSDYYALAVIHELRCNGVRVPEDMSVAGHDGSDVATSINLTTMMQPAREIGHITAHKALDLIAKKTLDQPRTVIQTVLTPGGTTRPIHHE